MKMNSCKLWRWFFKGLMMFTPLFVSAQKNKADDLVRYAISLENRNQYDSAIRYCSKAIDIDPKNAWAYLRRGRSYYDKVDYDKAILDYNMALELKSNYDSAYNGRANAYKGKGNFDQAIIDYNKAIAINPNYSNPYANRGDVYEQKRNYDQAFSDFRKAIELDPKNAYAYNFRGIAYDDQGNYDQAIGEYNKAIELSPNFSNAYANRGTVYVKKGNYDQAFLDFNKAIELNPKNAFAYNERGKAYNTGGKYELAIDDYNKAIEQTPGDADTYINRGGAYLNKGNYDQAIIEWSKAIDLSPGSSRAYNNRGFAYFKKGNYDGAIADYTKAIELDPGDALPLNNRGYACNSKGNFDQAIADYTKVIELSPKDANAYNNRGGSYKNEGKYGEALEDYKACLDLEPLNKYALLNTLSCLIRLNRFEEAASGYAKYKVNKIAGYIESDGWQYYKFYLAAATEYVRKGHYDEALAQLKKSEVSYNSNTITKKDLDPSVKTSYSDVLALKGYIFGKLDQRDDAVAAYNQSLIINTNQPDVIEGLNRLKNPKNIVKAADRTPPVIELINPVPSSTLTVLNENNTIRIVGRARDGAGIANLTIDGKAVDKLEEDGVFSATAFIKEGSNTITVTATDKAGNQSSKDFTFICSRNVTATNLNLPLLLNDGSVPKYYAILIAEQKYTDPTIPSLKKPIEEALQLKQTLETYYSFSSSNIDTLFNRNREDILGAIIQKCNTLNENDNLVILYSGHGVAEKDQFRNIKGYLVPCSAKRGNLFTYISSSDIALALGKSNARHILFIADACFSGALSKEIPREMPKVVKLVYQSPSRKMMTSGNLDPVDDNSVLMFYLLKRLKENKEKYLKADDLFNSLKDAVANNTESLPQYFIIKDTGDEGGEFVFIKK